MTTPDTDEILANIDRALWDYNTSADAMRWLPEPVVESPPNRVLHTEHITEAFHIAESFNQYDVASQSLTHYFRQLVNQMNQSIPVVQKFCTVVNNAISQIVIAANQTNYPSRPKTTAPRLKTTARERRLATQLRRRDRRREKRTQR
jgi:hypothetical protein